MKRVLIGWELGANRGHITAIRPVADALLNQGCEVHLALQQVDSAGLDCDQRIQLWQAPLWPRLLGSRPAHFNVSPATMGDILGRLGLDTPGSLTALVRSWDTILGAIKPELVVADFAPALLCASRGRFATVRVGNGFTTPPAHLDRYPLLSGEQAQYREDDLLDIADADLRSIGRPALTALPAIDHADHDLVRSFAEFDAYADRRIAGYVKPGEISWLADGKPPGDEIFCYLPAQMSPASPLWSALAASGRPIRIHMRGASAAHRAKFEEFRFALEAQPVPFERIAARSRLTVSHGGHGFVTASALAGLPQLVVGFDLEKLAIGRSVTSNGIGAYTDFFALESTSLNDFLNAAFVDEALAGRCRHFASMLASRALPSSPHRITEIVDAL